MKAFESRHEFICRMSICYVLPKHLKKMSVKTHIEPSSFVVCVLVTLCAAFLSLSFIFTFFLFRFQSIRSSIVGINGFNGIYFLYWCNFFSAGILAIELFQVVCCCCFFFGRCVYTFCLTLVLRFLLFYLGKVSLMRIWMKKINIRLPVQLIALRSPFSHQDFVLPPKMLAAALSHPKSRTAIQLQLLSPSKYHLQFADVVFFHSGAREKKKTKTTGKMIKMVRKQQKKWR